MPKLLENNLMKQVDLPVWEWPKASPIASAVGTCSCCARNSNYNSQYGRYV